MTAPMTGNDDFFPCALDRSVKDTSLRNATTHTCGHTDTEIERHTFCGVLFKMPELWDVCLQMRHKHILHHRTRTAAGNLETYHV